MLQGHVTLVREGKRVGPSAALHLEAETVTLPTARSMLWRRASSIPIAGTIPRSTTRERFCARITAKRRRLPHRSRGRRNGRGAMMGGLPGALIGAGVGAGVSTVVWMRQDRQADLPKDLASSSALLNRCGHPVERADDGCWRRRGGINSALLVQLGQQALPVGPVRRKDFFRSSRMRSKSEWPFSLRHAGFFVNQG